MTNDIDSIFSYVANHQPQDPIYLIRKHSIRKATKIFQHMFKGTIAYAVKTNSHPDVLTEIYNSGIKQFDVASLEEIKTVYSLFPSARQLYMNTIKPTDWINKAYFIYGIRDFAFDSREELHKILNATNSATDLHLHLRVAISNSHATIRLSHKFGAQPYECPELLKTARLHAKRLGLCFHVGSQCMHHFAYRDALQTTHEILKSTDVLLDSIDVGGGFPSVYPGMQPPALHHFINTIHDAYRKLELPMHCELIAEPGRALVAESGAVLVRVAARKDNMLYINDGTYGTLFDAGTLGFIYPTKLITTNRVPSKELIPFSFYGPTCDSIDYMEGPFYLPADVQPDDYIEIGQLGAYGLAMRTQFNGFYTNELLECNSPPLLSYYDDIEFPEYNSFLDNTLVA